MIAFAAACSHPTESPAGWPDYSESSEIWMTPSKNSSSEGTSGTLSTVSPADTPSTSGEGEISEESTDGPTLDEDSDTDTEESESELSAEDGGWGACGGDIPTECLSIVDDSASCPGTVGSCSWHRCASDRSTRWRIAYLQCLADECGFETAVDLVCLSEWADLALECFRTECTPSQPQACAFILRGAEHDCHT